MYLLLSFLQWYHLPKLQYHITTRTQVTTQSRYTPFHHHKDLSHLPFYSRTHLPPILPLYLILGNYQSFLLFYNFINSRMLHKRNHTVCNILEVAFSTRHNSLAICSGHCVSQQFVLFYHWAELQGMDVPQLFHCSPIKGHLVVSVFLLLPINLL